MRRTTEASGEQPYPYAKGHVTVIPASHDDSAGDDELAPPDNATGTPPHDDQYEIEES